MLPKPFLVVMFFLFIACDSAKSVEFINRAFTGDEQTVFVSAFQRYAKLNNSDGDERTRYSPSAAALAFHSTHGMLEAGFSLSYEEGTRKYRGDDHDYRVRARTAGMTIFTGFNGPLGLYVDQATYLGYGTFRGRDYYEPGGGRIRSTKEIHKYQFATTIEIGKVFHFPFGWSMAPHAGFEFARAPGETYNWSRGGGPRLKYHSQNSYEFSGGLSLGKTVSLLGLEVSASTDATVVGNAGRSDSMNYHPGFAYRTAKEWRVAGVSGDRLGARLRAGVDARLAGSMRLGVDYLYEKRKGYVDHRVSALLGWSF